MSWRRVLRCASYSISRFMTYSSQLQPLWNGLHFSSLQQKSHENTIIFRLAFVVPGVALKVLTLNCWPCLHFHFAKLVVLHATCRAKIGQDMKNPAWEPVSQTCSERKGQEKVKFTVCPFRWIEFPLPPLCKKSLRGKKFQSRPLAALTSCME